MLGNENHGLKCDQLRLNGVNYLMPQTCCHDCLQNAATHGGTAATPHCSRRTLAPAGAAIGCGGGAVFTSVFYIKVKVSKERRGIKNC